METTKKIADKMGILEKISLARRLEGGGTKSTGPHRIKMVSDSDVMGKDNDGKPRQEIRYVIEESSSLEEGKYDGTKKRWHVPVFAKGSDKDPHYLVERLMNIQPGDELIIEVKKSGKMSYIDVSPVGELGEMTDDEIDEEMDKF